MSKLSKLFSQNKKTLFLGLFLVLFFSFLPFQFLKLTTASAQNDFYCEKWGGVGYRCFGTVPLSACNNPISAICADDCDGKLGGDAARWSPSGNWEEGPFQWYCCNLPNNTNCFEEVLLAAPAPIDLASGTLPPPAPTNWWDNWNWGEKIENLGKNLLIGLPIAILAIISYFWMFIGGISVMLGGTLMTWIIEASLNISVVPGKAIEVVNIGWGVSRDLMNMAFILILVFIGLASILRLKQYEIKKTLPLLLVMALLVNFSGVIVGVIVDISNLITYSFVKGLDTFGSSLSLLWENTKNIVGGLLPIFTNSTEDPDIYIQSVVLPLGKIITTAAFFSILGITLFVVMMIFFLRIINLWIFVILAPIAFASYILPNTKGFWDSWWKNLITWSTVGIPISFFLYLSSKVLTLSAQNEISQAFGSGGSGWLATFIAQMMAPTVVIMLLWFGIGFSLASAPPAAKKIMEGGQAASQALRKRAQRLGQRIPGVVRGEFARMGRTYDAGRALALNLRRALGELIKRSWQRNWQLPTIRRRSVSAARGIWGAIRDSALAGTGKALDLKRKGSRTCPNLNCPTNQTGSGVTGRRISNSAKVCPHCGEDLS